MNRSRFNPRLAVLTAATLLPLPCLAAAGAILAVVSGVQAQPAAAIEPYWVVTKNADASLRCGDGTAWYPVAKLPRAQMLKVIGESGKDWLRVEYPAAVPAAVKLAEGELKADRGVVVLTRRSRLQAFNSGSPVSDECYAAVLDTQLDPGVELKYLGPINDNTGALGAYKVQAPSGARGYVLGADVRKATDDEVKKFLAAPAVPAAQPPAGESSPPAATDPVPTPASSGGTGTPIIDADPAGSSGAPATPATQPEVAPPVADEPATDPAATDGTTAAPPATVEPVKPEAPKGPTVNQLDAAFAVVVRQPLLEAEFSPLIQEYLDLMARMPAGSERTVQYIQARIELLGIREELQKEQLALEEMRRLATESADETRVRAEILARNREYLAVGRLVVSAMYDGQRLPLLYRLVSIDGAVGRTVAYISPVDGMNVDQYLDRLIGVQGEGQIDPRARVNMIRPTQIDLLRANEVGATGAAPVALPE